MSWRGVGSWACERLQKRARAPGLGQGPPPQQAPHVPGLFFPVTRLPPGCKEAQIG